MKRAAATGDKTRGDQPGRKKKTTKEADPTIQEQVFSKQGLFRQLVDQLYWKDAIALGSTNREYRASYLAYRETILGPLLKLLEEQCRSDVHAYCCKIFAPISQCVCTCKHDVSLEEEDLPEHQALGALDPRYKIGYESFSISEKCAAMIDFLSTLVTNMRPHLNLSMETIADPHHTPVVIGEIQGHWSLGVGVPGNAVLAMYPRRAAFAFNLALTCNAQAAMESGDNLDFNDAFLGVSGIDPGGSFFGQVICDMVLGAMVPLRNEDFVKFLRKSVLPTPEKVALLGPTLTSRLVLSAPLLDWIVSNSSDDVVLPPGLEEFDPVAVQRAMDEWDPEDDGRGNPW